MQEMLSYKSLPTQHLSNFVSFFQKLEMLTEKELTFFLSKSKHLTIRNLFQWSGRWNYDKNNDQFFQNFDSEFTKMWMRKKKIFVALFKMLRIRMKKKTKFSFTFSAKKNYRCQTGHSLRI